MSARAATMPSVDRALRLGFIGLGWIGRKRLDAVADHAAVQVQALADSDAPRLAAASAQYPQASSFANFAEVLEQELDGVVIATPNGCHAEQALACLARGLPVFCQKPLAISASDTRRVIDAARAADKLLAVDYSYRHVRGMQALRARIRAGEIGSLNAIDLVFHNAYGPDKSWCYDRSRSGGGCLLDLGVHLIDLALWLQGTPSLEVVSSRLYARGRPVRENEVEDLAYVELRAPNDAIVRLACSWNAQIGCDAQIGAHIVGSRAGARWRNVDGSFVDFELDLLRGNAQEHLGSSRDDWGIGALTEWIERLGRDDSFDDSACGIAEGARLIDEAYRA